MRQNNNNKDNVIVRLSFEFALQIIEFAGLLEEQRKFVISKQLLRSGTSIGACIRESQNAESTADFIHKMKIAAKEADETEYWMMLCQFSSDYPFNPELFSRLTEIKKLLNAIIATSKRLNQNKRNTQS